MDNFVKEGEQALNSFEQDQGGNQGQGQQTQGGQQKQQQQTSGGGGGGGLGQTAEDGFVNQEVDQFATKEGVPSGFDNAINSEVDKEVNSFS